MKPLSCNLGNRDAIASVAIRMFWLGTLTIAAASLQAAVVRVNATAPINEISGPNQSRLAEVSYGDILNFTYEYPSDLALTRYSNGSWLYDAPIGATFSTLQVGPIYREFSKLQLQLFEGVQNNFNPRPQTVDMAWLFAFDPKEPIDWISAMLIFEEGSLLGGPVLPSVERLVTYLEFTDHGDTVFDYARARGLVAVPFTPVPEASTFGVMGALGLVFLAVVRRIRIQKNKSAATAERVARAWWCVTVTRLWIRAFPKSDRNFETATPRTYH